MNSLNKFNAQLPKKVEEKNKILPQYVCSWLKDQKIREDLIKRIKYKKEKKQYQDNKIINDDTLSEQYFKIWMQQPFNKPLTKLAMHPLLKIQDQTLVDEIANTERNQQIKLSAMLTGGTVLFYWIFLSRMAKFQRFFNDRNKSKFVNWFKKTLGVYAILVAWQASMSSHYQKKVPQLLNERGLFKKYGIQFEQKNV